jgi:hypothetical protein
VDELHQVIQAFSETEQKEFRRFIQRNRYKNFRKDLDLFNSIVKNKSTRSRSHFAEIYSGTAEERNAYHSLRKRLVQHVHDFLYIKQSGNEDSTRSEITKNIVLAGVYFDQQLQSLAWKYLNRAERLAEEADLSQVLVQVYDLQITHYNQQYISRSIDKLIGRRLKAGRFAEEEDRLQIIGSLVKQELEKVKLEGAEIDLQKIIDRLFVRFEMDDSVFNRPRLLYDFVLLTRNVVLADKRFFSFEGFVLNSYERVRKSGFFDQKNAEHLTMLYIVSHTLYRNRKFDEAVNYLSEMNKKLNEVSKTLINRFNARCSMMLAASKNLSGQLNESIAILESLLAGDIKSNPDVLNARLNLSVYYFQQNDFRRAHRVLVSLGHTDRWLEKTMGVEWLLKKNLIEIVFLCELGKPEIAYDRLNYLERSNKDLFKTRKYARVSVFIKLIRQIIDNPAEVNSSEFREKVENSFVWVNIEEEDLQAVSYYAWLKAKMYKRPFYAVLLELMNYRQGYSGNIFH